MPIPLFPRPMEVDGYWVFGIRYWVKGVGVMDRVQDSRCMMQVAWTKKDQMMQIA